jgi:hypothetical protein
VNGTRPRWWRLPEARIAVAACFLLFVGACGDGGAGTSTQAGEPLRRASFRVFATRDFLLSCPGSAGRGAVAAQAARYAALTQLAAGKGAAYAIWAGGNDWAGLSSHGPREHCPAGADGYIEALAAYRGALDDLARRIAEYRP